MKYPWSRSFSLAMVLADDCTTFIALRLSVHMGSFACCLLMYDLITCERWVLDRELQHMWGAQRAARGHAHTWHSPRFLSLTLVWADAWSTLTACRMLSIPGLSARTCAFFTMAREVGSSRFTSARDS